MPGLADYGVRVSCISGRRALVHWIRQRRISGAPLGPCPSGTLKGPVRGPEREGPLGVLKGGLGRAKLFPTLVARRATPE